MPKKKEPYKYGDFTIPEHWYLNGYKEGMNPDLFRIEAVRWKLKDSDGKFYGEYFNGVDWRGYWGKEAGSNTYFYTDAKFMQSHLKKPGITIVEKSK